MSSKLAHFEILEQIGKGGMATVYRAFDPSLKRHVAIKTINPELIEEDPQFLENFLIEAQNAAAINHPNIVQIYFIGEEEGVHYLVMELLEGQTLDEILESIGAIEEGAVLKMAIQLAEALRAAYANQLVHGDIKPQNIFITSRGDAKLLDFGLAKLANVEVMNFEAAKQGRAKAREKGDGVVWGSPYYISPERVGQKAEDFRSDIYSLGATIFHALVGHPPFEAETPGELAIQRLHEQAPPLRQINPYISEPTAAVVAKMLEKTPFVRHVNYEELLAELHKAASYVNRRDAGGLQTTSAPAAGAPASRAPRKEAPPEKSSPLVLVLIVALVVVGGALAFLLLRQKPTSTPGQASSTPGVSTTAPPDAAAPFAEYKFNGNTRDSVDSNDGTPVDSPDYVAGISDRAISLNGTSNYVALPPGIANSSELTVTARIKWNGGDPWTRIFDFGTGTDAFIFLTARDNIRGTPRFAIKNGGAEQDVMSSQPLPIGEWVQVTATLGEGTGTIYINGKKVGSGLMTITPSSFNPSVNYIGKSQFAPDPLFNGRIDDLRIYHRVLTEAEVSKLATSSGIVTPATPTPATPVEASVALPEVPTYMDATPENTTGSTFPTTPNDYTDNQWSLRAVDSDNATVRGNTVLEAGPDGGSEHVPEIATKIGGLKPGATYEIYVYFLTHPFSNTSQNYQVRAGLKPGQLTTFDRNSPAAPVLSPGSTTALNDASGNPIPIPGTIDYRQASLGPAVADASGTITVYIDAGPGDNNANNRAWYDGVGYKLVKP